MLSTNMQYLYAVLIMCLPKQTPGDQQAAPEYTMYLVGTHSSVGQFCLLCPCGEGEGHTSHA